MSYTVRLVQSRPNTGVEFYTPGSTQLDRLEEWKTAGKIISYNLSSLSADQLTKTSTIEFNAEGNYTEFFGDSVFDEAAQARIEYNTANNISYSLETPE
tara:strand:+ start:371 stop:667 length:297 start_codon:yes stop_codon:yes gene_type:complete